MRYLLFFIALTVWAQGQRVTSPLSVTTASTTPTITFYRSGSTQTTKLTGTSTQALGVLDDSNNNRLTVFQNGHVQVGSTTDQGYPLFVNGNLHVDGDVTCSGSCGGGGGSSAPFSDASAILKNAADNTKLLQFSLAGITTGTSRTWTIPNANMTPAGLELTQTFTGGVNTFFNATDTLINLRQGSAQGTWLLQGLTNAGAQLWGFGNTGDFVTSRNIKQGHAGSTQVVYTHATSGVDRFALFTEADGSAISLGRYDNSGVFVDAPWSINRASGILTIRDATCVGTCTGFGAGGGGTSPPFSDDNPLVRGSGDVSKMLRFEVDGFTTGVTRSITFMDADYQPAATNIDSQFSANQTFSGNIFAGAAGKNIGAGILPFGQIYGAAVYSEGFKIAVPGTSMGGAATLEQVTTEVTRLRDTAGNVMQDWSKTVPAYSAIYADFIPGDSSRTIGRNSNPWNAVWTVNLTASGTTTLNNATCVGTCTGFGGGGSGANTTLSNLGTTAINSDLLPSSNNTRNIGASNNQFANIFGTNLWTCFTSGGDCWRMQSVTSGSNALQFTGPGGTRLSLGANSSAFLGNSVGTLYPLLIMDTGGSPGINFYRNGGPKAGSISSGGTAALSVQDQFDNFRMVVMQSGNVEIGSTTDHGNNLDVHGVLNVTSGIKLNGTFGFTTSVNVRNSAGSGSCTLTFTFGSLTGSTC